MEKIAFVSTGYRAVPAVNGGAIETLMTYILEENEINHKYDIDLYTIDDEKISERMYNNTNIISVKQNKVLNLICKVLNFIFRKIRINRVILYFPIQFAKKINLKKYDKIIIENNMVLYKYIHSKYKYNAKFYFHLHNNVNQPGKTKEYAEYIAKTADNILFVSDFIKKSFNKITNCNIGTVLYNTIDFNKYNVQLCQKKNQYRNLYNISKDNYNFIYMGRICEDKGVLELIDAFSKLSNNYKNISLSIIGFGFNKIKNPFENMIINKISKNNNIFKYGFMPTDKLLEHLVASDCVIIPSKCEEAFGLVAIEAMAMQKTIISTNAGGLTESLDNKTALIIDRTNLEEKLYSAMERLLLDRKLSDELALNAYNKIIKNNTYNKKNYFNNFVQKIG